MLVSDLMCTDITPLGKSLLTNVTGERFLACVAPLMSLVYFEKIKKSVSESFGFSAWGMRYDDYLLLNCPIARNAVHTMAPCRSVIHDINDRS